MIENGKARVVSRPNVTTMSGKDAKILIGGEIPYQTSNGFGATSTDYKEQVASEDGNRRPDYAARRQ